MGAVSLGLSSPIFAASEQDHQITGKIVQINPGATGIVIDDGETDGGAYVWFMRDTKYGTKPKIGERVTVHYEIGGRKMYVTKIEKAGKAEKGSKKIKADGQREPSPKPRKAVGCGFGALQTGRVNLLAAETRQSQQPRNRQARTWIGRRSGCGLISVSRR